MKIEAVTTKLDQRIVCMEQLKKRKNCLVSSSLSFNIEITPQHVYKAAMAKAVLAYYHIKESQALIFGDSDNDLQLFEQFSNCVALANASDHIKEKAVYIAPSCEADGVAAFLERYLLC